MERFTTDENGSVALEFVLSTLMFMVIMLLSFQLFRVTFQSSQAQLQARQQAFSQIAGKGIIAASQAQAMGVKASPPAGCQSECEQKLNFQVDQGMRRYPYGLAEFKHQVKQNFILKLGD